MSIVSDASSNFGTRTLGMADMAGTVLGGGSGFCLPEGALATVLAGKFDVDENDGVTISPMGRKSLRLMASPCQLWVWRG